MPGISRTTRQSILDTLFAAGAYVALFTVAPTATGGGTECTGGSYARKQHLLWHAATAAEPSVVTNNGQILFVTATAGWGAVVAFALFNSALPGGTMLAYGTCAKTISSGDTASFADAVLAVTLNET